MNELSFGIRQTGHTPVYGLPHHPTLCPLIMVGDPNIETTRDLLQRCIDLGVGMVELCLPFENAFTDGTTLLRAHKRALSNDIDLKDALPLIEEFGDQIHIILLADSSYTLRKHGFYNVCKAARDAGAAGILPHGLPPLLAKDFIVASDQVLPVVGTIYANSNLDVRRRVLEQSSAFIYLVSAYGRSGGADAKPDLAPQIAALRSKTDLPIALGFGLKSPADVAGAFAMGCDIAIVGSAISGVIETALNNGLDPVETTAAFIKDLNSETQK